MSEELCISISDQHLLEKIADTENGFVERKADARSVAQVEIRHVPDPDHPHESQAGQQDGGVCHLCPNPATCRSPRLKELIEDDDRRERSDETRAFQQPEQWHHARAQERKKIVGS